MATTKGFESALQKLEEAVEQLESGELSLEQAQGLLHGSQTRRDLPEVPAGRGIES